MSKPRILFVDDEQVPTNSYLEVFRLEGFEVAHAISPTSALKAVRDKNFDIIFLDIMIPWDDAISAAQSENGAVCGIPLYNKLAETRPTSQIFFLTNVYNEDLLRRLPLTQQYLLEKSKYSPLKLIDFVNDL